MKKLVLVVLLISIVLGCSDDPVSPTEQGYDKVVIYGDYLIDSINVVRKANGLSELNFTLTIYSTDDLGEFLPIDIKEYSKKRNFKNTEHSKWEMSEVRNATCIIGGVKRWSSYDFSPDAFNNKLIQKLLTDKREDLAVYLEIVDYPKQGVDYFEDNPDIEHNAKWDIVLFIQDEFEIISDIE